MENKLRELKLLPVLIPRPLWGINAHDLVERDCWEKIRRDTFLRDKKRCVICGKQGPLECHEVFTFDDANGIATLARLESRCSTCHACNHLGRLYKRNPPGFKQALVYLAKINKMQPQEVIDLVKDAFKLHKARTRPWEMKVAEELLRCYPELQRLEGRYSVETSTQ